MASKRRPQLLEPGYTGERFGHHTAREESWGCDQITGVGEEVMTSTDLTTRCLHASVSQGRDTVITDDAYGMG
jgi:hypothetical protein